MELAYAKPKQGCKITIDFAHKSYNIHNSDPVTFSLTGVVVADTKWTPNNCVRILTSHDIVPVREIPLDKITSIKYEDGTSVQKQLVEDELKTYIVQGSKDNVYTVINNKTAWTCSCPGFQFRKICKHVEKFRNVPA